MNENTDDYLHPHADLIFAAITADRALALLSRIHDAAIAERDASQAALVAQARAGAGELARHHYAAGVADRFARMVRGDAP